MQPRAGQTELHLLSSAVQLHILASSASGNGFRYAMNTKLEGGGGSRVGLGVSEDNTDFSFSRETNPDREVHIPVTIPTELHSYT